MTMPKSNEPCWCGSGKKFKRCHKDSAPLGIWDPTVRKGNVTPQRSVPANIVRPDYVDNKGKPKRNNYPLIKDASTIARMRSTNQATAQVLQEVGRHVRVGITTEELDVIAHDAYIARDGYPSCVGYGSYQKSVCTSINEVICHGIPDDRPLQEGDIVNVDVSMFREGVHGDCSATFFAGEPSETARRLVAVTEECMYLGIKAAKPGGKLNEVGRAIQDNAEKHGYNVVRAFVGHGIGENFHMAPSVLHYFDRSVRDSIQPGMTFTVEPMIAVGTYDYYVWDDDWTAVTADHGLTAQFEHTVLVTESGIEILSRP